MKKSLHQSNHGWVQQFKSRFKLWTRLRPPSLPACGSDIRNVRAVSPAASVSHQCPWVFCTIRVEKCCALKERLAKKSKIHFPFASMYLISQDTFVKNVPFKVGFSVTRLVVSSHPDSFFKAKPSPALYKVVRTCWSSWSRARLHNKVMSR